VGGTDRKEQKWKDNIKGDGILIAKPDIFPVSAIELKHDFGQVS